MTIGSLLAACSRWFLRGPPPGPDRGAQRLQRHQPGGWILSVAITRLGWGGVWRGGAPWLPWPAVSDPPAPPLAIHWGTRILPVGSCQHQVPEEMRAIFKESPPPPAPFSPGAYRRLDSIARLLIFHDPTPLPPAPTPS